MASGLPVVGTDIEGVRGVVAPEVNGLLVPPDDVAALTGALGRLVSDHALRVRFGAASRELACSTFSLARCVGDTQDLFTAVARPFAGAAGLPRSSVVRL
jgi:glycosyltransferase involved in cell wall biosynthesis